MTDEEALTEAVSRIESILTETTERVQAIIEEYDIELIGPIVLIPSSEDEIEFTPEKLH